MSLSPSFSGGCNNSNLSWILGDVITMWIFLFFVKLILLSAYVRFGPMRCFENIKRINKQTHWRKNIIELTQLAGHKRAYICIGDLLASHMHMHICTLMAGAKRNIAHVLHVLEGLCLVSENDFPPDVLEYNIIKLSLRHISQSDLILILKFKRLGFV